MRRWQRCAPRHAASWPDPGPEAPRREAPEPCRTTSTRRSFRASLLGHRFKTDPARAGPARAASVRCRGRRSRKWCSICSQRRMPSRIEAQDRACADLAGGRQGARRDLRYRGGIDPASAPVSSSRSSPRRRSERYGTGPQYLQEHHRVHGGSISVDSEQGKARDSRSYCRAA